MLDVGGDYAFRLRGEDHAWTPDSVGRLQHAVRGNLPDEYKAFARTINEQTERLLTIRGLMSFRFAEQAVPIEEVEPAASIVRRFATGAMSFGSQPRGTPRCDRQNRIGGSRTPAAAETDRCRCLTATALSDQAGGLQPLRRTTSTWSTPRPADQAQGAAPRAASCQAMSTTSRAPQHAGRQPDPPPPRSLIEDLAQRSTT